MKLSVIIPVYNVEKYIEECLVSLAKSTCEDVEFLVVNDGTKDNSMALVQRFVEADARFRILEKKNGGLSDARNAGVLASQGKYLFFLDSDDWVMDGMLEEVLQVLNEKEPDMLVFDMMFEWENSNQKKLVKGFIENSDSVKGLLRATPSACNKIMKRELAEKYPFPVGMYYEDLATVPMMYTEAKRVIYVDKPYYRYRQREGSIIYTFSEKNLDVFKCFDRILNHYNNQKLFEDYHDELECMLIEHLMLYGNRRFIHSQKPDEYLNKSKNYLNKWFKNWKKNPYFSMMSLNDRLFISVASTGNAGLLKILLKIKGILRGA